MVLKADDELRHAHTDDVHWRESVYWNLHGQKDDLGLWVYIWVLPNQPKKTGMIVSVYKGLWSERDITSQALAAPGNILRRGDDFVYFFYNVLDDLTDENFDNISVSGLELRRLSPLSEYKIRFDNKAGTTLDLDCKFLTPPFDYAVDGFHQMPPFLAQNRYHRLWKAKGAITVEGKKFDVDCTGNSDHSWGSRDYMEFNSHIFKLWAFATPDGRLAVSVIEQHVGEGMRPLGFISIDGKVASIAELSMPTKYNAAGIPVSGDVLLRDELGREVRGKFLGQSSCIGLGVDRYGIQAAGIWGYEGHGNFVIDGYGHIPGMAGYFFPRDIKPEELHAGKYK